MRTSSLTPEGRGVGKLEELFCLYAELFHARQQSGPINAYARCSSVSATDSTFGFLQNTRDLLAAVVIVLFAIIFHGAIGQGTYRFFDTACPILIAGAVADWRR